MFTFAAKLSPIFSISRSMSFYTNLFRLAALWNITAAFIVFLSFKKHFSLFYDITIGSKTHFLLWLYHYNFWFIVLMMGIGYYLVSRNLRENWAIVLLGIVGKTTIALSWCYLYYIGHGTKLLLLGALGDLLFACLFLRFLWTIDQLES